MKTIALSLLLLTAAAPVAAQEIVIEDFIGTLEIVEGPRLTIEGARDGTAKRRGDSLRVDGGEKTNRIDCNTRNGRTTIRAGGLFARSKPLSAYPSLRIEAPKGTDVRLRDSIVLGEIESVGEADIVQRGCGKLSIGRVASGKVASRGSSDVSIDVMDTGSASTTGSGKLMVGRGGDLTLTTTGSGSATLRQGGSLSLRSTGSGSIRVGRMDGDLTAATTGSGSIQIAEGRVATAALRSTGSGSIKIAVEADRVDAVSTGSGRITVAGERVGSRR